MRRQILYSMLILVLCVLGAGPAGADVAASWETTNDNPDAATDYHVIVKAPGATGHGASWDEPPMDTFTLTPQPDNVFVGKWDVLPGHTVPPGGSTGFGIGFFGSNNAEVLDAFWTGEGHVRLDQDKEELPGFRKTDGGSATYYLINSTPSPMTIQGLRFLLNQPQVPLPLMRYGTIPGPWTAPLPDFIIPAASEWSHYLASAAAGMWQLAEFQVPQTNSPNPIFVMHQFDVIPEPTCLLLLGIGAACLVRRRR